jgi:hypothetical protein
MTTIQPVAGSHLKHLAADVRDLQLRQARMQAVLDCVTQDSYTTLIKVCPPQPILIFYLLSEIHDLLRIHLYVKFYY